jgi:predicted HD superfamily hydrolase involved in NAD metabolism
LRDYLYIKNEVQKMLKPKRFKHSLGVEKETVKLCKLYHVNEEEGRLASILHDCAKGFSAEKLLDYAKVYQIDVDEIMLDLPDLLHGPIAAMYAKECFGLENEDIFNAIWYHTTGRKYMSKLEKIIYLADMIEEDRKFNGIEEIRNEALIDLDKALLMSCNCTIGYIIKENRLIHPLTIELRNSLLVRGASEIG